MIVIVGGGVIGCSIAYELASRHHQKVTVLERAVPGAEASSAAAGILGAQVEAHAPGPLFDLMLASRARHEELDARLRETVGFGTGYRRCGLLQVGSPEELAKKYEWQRGQKVRVLDTRGARAIEPALAESIEGAVHLEDEAQVDPPLLLRALQQACAHHHVIFRTGTIVRSVKPGLVELDDGTIEADAIIIAAGSWSSLVGGLPPDLRRVRPVRGQIVQVETRPPIVRSIVFGPRGYVIARPDGRTLLGSTMEEVGHVKEVTVGGVHQVLSHALALLPSIARAPITATWSGFRPATPEDRPMLGVIEPGLFAATGHHRNGVLLSAETARVIADLVATGRSDRDLTPFSPKTS
ncbi:MAG: glycine oxidase ThiO [Polyangiales bacterium]